MKKRTTNTVAAKKKAKPRTKLKPFQFEEWMITSAHHVASILPAEHNEALAVLALAKQIVLKINKPYVGRLRGAVFEEDLRDYAIKASAADSAPRSYRRNGSRRP